MYSHVNFETFVLSETGIADFTGKRSDASMVQRVAVEIAFGCEGFWTDCTLKWTLSSVGPHVN